MTKYAAIAAVLLLGAGSPVALVAAAGDVSARDRSGVQSDQLAQRRVAPSQTKVIVAPASTAPKVDAAYLVDAAGAEKPKERIASSERESLMQTIEGLRRGETEAANESWMEFIRSRARRSQKPDVGAYLRYIVRESYLETNKDLRMHAEKVRFYRAQSRELGRFVAKTRKDAAGSSSDRAQTVTVREPVAAPFVPGGAVLTYQDEETVAKPDLHIKINRIETAMHTADENADAAMRDLENAIQQQSRRFQTISNTIRAMHEAAMNVIRNMK